ncbi:hypothetical protein BJD52_gp18 [Salmonella phage BP12B]|uniref:Uncharacterized protein n=1 Tax=Salmonella phage BP12B TaxID=1543201 RepID=A0A140XFS3_9CAUD|nr:hypothetical protein [Salmonella enterica]YP_009304438.1 hypothetical protein BJD52_gp18 [Salmonella phage BP12B]EGS7279748.1 hypothetical protein [Salmonella enterica subsp. enterica serovar Enteritidis]EGX1369388.1 hypothetical protein [Salmonella enterica subsp. enterica serovar Typhimurium]UUJ74839.1 hypothetical protein GRNsp03_150 [Salmonella phage GRNsp03]AIT13693.1 hypothetical protein BP12B_18 [Salmonella phage BP12B]
MFTIETIVNRVVKGATLVSVESFIIVDEAGSLVAGTKAYDTREEAQAKIDSMGNFATGLEFARACFPEQADKAQIGKANIVAEYLDWIAAGKPVKEVKAAEEDEAPAVEEAAPEVPVSEEEEF